MAPLSRCRWGLAARLLLAPVLGAVVACDATPRPSIVLITVDTLRADAVGFLGGSAATPVLDELARGGAVFTRATTPLPRTTPGVGSILTGLWPHHHGSREVGNPLREVETLATILRRHGYVTLGVNANPAAGRRQRVDRGFDHWLDPSELPGGERPGGRPGWATTEGVRRLLARLDGKRPYFLWVLYFDPHFPYLPPPPWAQGIEAPRCRELYGKLDEGLALGGVFADLEGVASEAVADCRRLYDAEVTYVDAEIGRLLALLPPAPGDGEPLIVVTADHGENLGEGGLYFEHGENLHDAAVRVPLLLRGRGVAGGRRDDGAVSLVDVAPTVLSLLGLPPVAGVDGEDLSPRLDCPPVVRPRPRVVFAESGSALWNQSFDRLTTGRLGGRTCLNGPRYTLCRSVREGGAGALYDRAADPLLARDLAAAHPLEAEELRAAWARWPPESGRDRMAMAERYKLLATPRLDGGYHLALYDLAADPAERHDRRADRPEIAGSLARALEGWARELPERSDTQLDPEVLQALRSLGYIE